MGIVEARKMEALHYFRHLLRAATYLPDEYARLYIHNDIVRRFRKHAKDTARLDARLQKAQRSLNILQRAVDGGLKPLTSVLFRAYGRTGRKRRKLIVELLRAEQGFAPEDGADPESIIAGGINPDGSWKSPRPLFDKLVRSQVAHHPADNPRPTIRRIKPTIPRTIWDTPITVRRQQNILHKFWSDLLQKILPPLPEMEWNRLRDLATGVIPFEGPPPRRSRPASKEKPVEPSSLLTTSFLTTPVRAAARPEKDARVRKMHKHNLTPRFMRRVWATVWNISPLASYDGDTQQWNVVWGGGKTAASKGLISSATGRDFELFEGIDKLERPKLRQRMVKVDMLKEAPGNEPREASDPEPEEAPDIELPEHPNTEPKEAPDTGVENESQVMWRHL